MDNENLEVVNLENADATSRLPWNANVDTSKLTNQVLPIVGGAAAAGVIGYLLYRFVAKPLIAKHKAKKQAESVVEAPAEEAKSEES